MSAANTTTNIEPGFPEPADSNSSPAEAAKEKDTAGDTDKEKAGTNDEEKQPKGSAGAEEKDITD